MININQVIKYIFEIIIRIEKAFKIKIQAFLSNIILLIYQMNLFNSQIYY